MRIAMIAVAAAAMLSGCVDDGYDRPYAGWRQYDYNRPDPSYGGYEADRYYRDDSRYHERRLSERERIYRGRDGRYYCRRSDGTTGLVVGAIAGGVLGNIIKIRPPIVFRKEHADIAIAAIDRALGRL